jgi:hypothetical protein
MQLTWGVDLEENIFIALVNGQKQNNYVGQYESNVSYISSYKIQRRLSFLPHLPDSDTVQLYQDY